MLKAILICKKAFENDQLFSGYLAFGIGIWFAFVTLANVGAAPGIVPTKGLTLPLISYGGSSLIVMSVGGFYAATYRSQIFEYQKEQADNQNELAVK